MSGIEAFTGALLFVTAFWASAATLHLFDAKANCKRLEKELKDMNVCCQYWKAQSTYYKARAKFDGAIYGDKSNA